MTAFSFPVRKMVMKSWRSSWTRKKTTKWRPWSSTSSVLVLQRLSLRVLELGAGTGMVGILCATLGAHSILTDLPHVVPNLQHNAMLNQDVVSGSGLGGSIEVRTLRWGERADVDDVTGSPVDLIVASDVVYYDHLFEPLLCTLKWLLHSEKCHEEDVTSKIQDDPLIETDINDCVSSLAMRREFSRQSQTYSSADGIGRASCMCSTTGIQESKNEGVAYSNGHLKASAEHDGGPLDNAARKEVSPLVLLAHLRRWKKDSRFFKKASKIFEVKVVHKQLEGTGSRTGVTVYSLARYKK
ncbi:hypothetical protein KP509_25G004200 [Ceratopteris richardii]|uniref:Uncharacterized protein n=1 Tax=Ceratopteris richardii TaxID=49495 RepID=A0A8T2RPL2_CERRI|nr:hypothetical protein KP509_25G004200 [Ceratopteris richardii]